MRRKLSIDASVDPEITKLRNSEQATRFSGGIRFFPGFLSNHLKPNSAYSLWLRDTTENGELVEGKYRTKNKMLTTEDAVFTKNEYAQMVRPVKGRGRLARGPRSASGRGGDSLI